MCTTAKTSYNAITSPHGATMESFPFSMKFNCTLERPVDAVRNLLFEGEGKKKGMLTSSTCVYHFFPPSSPLSLSLSVLGAHPRCAPPFGDDEVLRRRTLMFHRGTRGSQLRPRHFISGNIRYLCKTELLMHVRRIYRSRAIIFLLFRSQFFRVGVTATVCGGKENPYDTNLPSFSPPLFSF